MRKHIIPASLLAAGLFALSVPALAQLTSVPIETKFVNQTPDKAKFHYVGGITSNEVICSEDVNGNASSVCKKAGNNVVAEKGKDGGGLKYTVTVSDPDGKDICKVMFVGSIDNSGGSVGGSNYASCKALSIFPLQKGYSCKFDGSDIDLSKANKLNCDVTVSKSK